MIILIEPFARPFSHIIVVNSLVSGIAEHSNEKILFISTKEYFDTIPDHIKSKLIFQSITKKRFFSGNKLQIFLFLRFSEKYKNEKPLVIFLSSKIFANIIIKLIARISHKTKVISMIHGELSILSAKVSWNIRRLMSKMALKTLLILNSKYSNSMTLMLISDFVYSELSNYFDFTLKNILHSDLPYVYEEKVQLENRFNRSLRFATIGVNSITKNSHLINDVSDYFKQELINEEMKLSIVGRIEGFVPNENISTIGVEEGQLIDELEYSKKLNSSDVFLFFNDDSYNLVSSASYFEAIAYGKPILALKNKQWQYNFDKYGEIGFLFDNLDEMKSVIKKLIVNPSILDDIKANLIKAKQISSILNPNNSSVYMEILKLKEAN